VASLFHSQTSPFQIYTKMMQAVVLLAVLAVSSSQLIPPLPVVGRNCLAHVAEVENSGLLGAFKPKCDTDGTYSALQTHASIGMSFCVDKLGQTLLAPQRGLKACACPRERAQQLQGSLIGARVPQCDTDGTYSALQVWGSTGISRCVREDGTTLLEGRGIRSCKCPRARELAQGNGTSVGKYVPQCNNQNGSYNQVQHHGSTGYSWCVNEDGVQVGAAVPPGQTVSC
jgi:hypothetical protein